MSTTTAPQPQYLVINETDRQAEMEFIDKQAEEAIKHLVDSGISLEEARIMYSLYFQHRANSGRIPTTSGSGKKWTFNMINPPECRRVNQAILDGDEPFITTKVWNAMTCAVTYNEGIVRLSRQELAKEARVSVSAVSRSAARLEAYRAIKRRKDGRGVIYVIDPRVGWAGQESKRQEKLAHMKDEAERIHRQREREPRLTAVE